MLRDPDRLLVCPEDEVRSRLSSGPDVLLVRHSLQLRKRLRDSLSGHWVLIDQTTDKNGHSLLFAPDLMRILEPGMLVCRTVRDYLVHCTDDRSWPQEVESFPYRELAREHSAEFIRAYEDFRASKPVGFSSVDLLLIGASAVLQRNLFALENPFAVIELSFHSSEKWKHLEDYFGVEDIQAVRDHLRQLPKPLGDLFSGQAQAARLACATLLILSPHLEIPACTCPTCRPH
ncbi:MAG: hypothetical protein ACXWYD_12605 [Candidatus Binatia bacterium]